MCTPRPRCRPAHVKQMKVPNFGDAHWGEGAEQSMQVVFPGRFCRVASCMEINQKGVKDGRRAGGTLVLVSGSTSHILRGFGRSIERGKYLLDDP